jgi:DNA-binding LacI/PurR family transcriptional regulator
VNINVRKIRIEDVANEAGVSTTAVSFAFNNPHRLNYKTVERIMEVADRLGYLPNPHARALLAKAVGVIGILTPQSLPTVFANPFFATFHEGIAGVCEENRLALMVISPTSGSLSEASAKAPVDGLIVVGLTENHPEIELLRRRQVPFVIVDGDATTVPSVNIDDENGAWQAANYLLQRGHRNILCLTFEQDFSDTHGDKVYGVGQRRLEGYKRAFRDNGVTWDDQCLFPTPTSTAAGADAFRQLWRDIRPRPTAMLAVADIIAIGALHAAVTSGVNVPHDLAIIGFDDIPQAMWTNPPLTTVHQPTVEKGEIAAQMLLSLIAAAPLPETHIRLPTGLVIRQSA